MAKRSEQAPDQELLSYEELRAFVEANGYAVTDATRLWNTITANLPLHDSCFCIYTSDGKRMTVAAYKKWRDEAAPWKPRDHDSKVRRTWRVGRRHIERFQEHAKYMTPKEIDEYGPVARKILDEWLNS